jgi:hypothetical protein
MSGILRGLYRGFRNRLSVLKHGLGTSVRRAAGKSDYGRWSGKKALSADWDSRTKQIADLVKPGSKVLEFGAGRMVLKGFLPEGCSYTPSDLVDRGPGTIVLDLNGESLPSFEGHDVAAFSGVLEYVNDVPRLVAHLSRFVGTVVASYGSTELNGPERRAQGWVNDYSTSQFIDVFKAAGFLCDHTEQWRTQVICRFVKV